MPRSMHRLADDQRRDCGNSGRRHAAFAAAATVAFVVSASVAAQTPPSSAGQIPDLASTTFALLALGADWRDPPAGSGRGPVRQDPDHPFVGNVGNNGRQVTVRLGNYRDPVLKPWAAAQMREFNEEVISGKRAVGSRRKRAAIRAACRGNCSIRPSRCISSRRPKRCG